MENGPMISVIMPVYNVEKYLDRAVESVLNQTHSNLELILVDDCSPDGSGKKCDEWAMRDSRVRVVHKLKNEGLGFARNTGLQCAEGDYILFVDSDDWIDSAMFSNMIKAAKENCCEIVVCGYSQDYTDSQGRVEYSVNVSMPRTIAQGHQEVLKATVQIDNNKLFSFAWNKLYSAKLIKRSGCLFTKTKLIEDFLFNMDIFDNTKKIIVIPQIYYHYLKPTHDTLISAYCENFQEIIDLRFRKARECLIRANIYEGKTRALLANIYIKHIYARLERDCWPECQLRFGKRYALIKDLLLMNNTHEAIQYCQAFSRSAGIMNAFLKSKNAFTIAVSAKLLWILKKRLPKLFNMIKQH